MTSFRNNSRRKVEGMNALMKEEEHGNKEFNIVVPS
jgi:hypothetical protein